MNHPITHTTCQAFTLLTRRWRITRVLELIAADPNAAQVVERADITRLDELPSLTRPAPGHVTLLEVQVDPVHVATTDLTTPVLVAWMFPDAGDNLGAMVIDGWHRIYRARSEGDFAAVHADAALLDLLRRAVAGSPGAVSGRDGDQEGRLHAHQEPLCPRW